MCRNCGSGTPQGGRRLQGSMDAQHAARHQERHLHHQEPILWRRDSQLWVEQPVWSFCRCRNDLWWTCLLRPPVDYRLEWNLFTYWELYGETSATKWALSCLGPVRSGSTVQCVYASGNMTGSILTAWGDSGAALMVPRSCLCLYGPEMESTLTLPLVPGNTSVTLAMSCWLQPQNAVDNNWRVVDLNVFSSTKGFCISLAGCPATSPYKIPWLFPDFSLTIWCFSLTTRQNIDVSLLP